MRELALPSLETTPSSTWMRCAHNCTCAEILRDRVCRTCIQQFSTTVASKWYLGHPSTLRQTLRSPRPATSSRELVLGLELHLELSSRTVSKNPERSSALRSHTINLKANAKKSP